jgi:hypothetical protein
MIALLGQLIDYHKKHDMILHSRDKSKKRLNNNVRNDKYSIIPKNVNRFHLFQLYTIENEIISIKMMKRKMNRETSTKSSRGSAYS